MNTLAAVLLFAVSLFAVSSPNIDVIDDQGRVRSTAEWNGTPTILAPMYARCPLACPMIAQGVKRGAAESSAPISSYRVVIFSFDPRDTPADLRRFRERQRLPLHWSVVKAVHKGDERRLLDALDYHYGQAGNHWIHPNAIIALTADGVPAKTLNGTNYDIDAALAAARGGRDWIDRYGGWMLALLLFVCLLSVVYLGSLLSTGRSETSSP
jgi:cytochrome oxidase Cu insertion factor (SCO1/SenC/PrrC family)